MKNTVMTSFYRLVFTVFSSLMAMVSLAQDKGIDVDIDIKKERQWYDQPWVWVVGAAIFILLLVAILRGGRTQKE